MGQERHAKNEGESAPRKNQEICGGEIILNRCVSPNFMQLHNVSNFRADILSSHCLGRNDKNSNLLYACKLYHQFGMFMHFTSISSSFSQTIHFCSPPHHEAFTHSFILSGFSIAVPFMPAGTQNNMIGVNWGSGKASVLPGLSITSTASHL